LLRLNPQDVGVFGAHFQVYDSLPQCDLILVRGVEAPHQDHQDDHSDREEQIPAHSTPQREVIKGVPCDFRATHNVGNSLSIVIRDSAVFDVTVNYEEAGREYHRYDENHNVKCNEFQ
jgi:hypothetical protein